MALASIHHFMTSSPTCHTNHRLCDWLVWINTVNLTSVFGLSLHWLAVVVVDLVAVDLVAVDLVAVDLAVAVDLVVAVAVELSLALALAQVRVKSPKRSRWDLTGGRG